MKMAAKWEGQMKFAAVGESGHTVLMDSSVANGGEGKGPSPMELLLMGLEGCSGIDVVAILGKMRELPDSVTIEADADRHDTEPRRFTSIRLLFRVEGKVKPASLERAIRLSLEKYCSAANSLNAAISYAYEINGSRVPETGYKE